MKAVTFVLDGSNNETVARHCSETTEPFYVNGMRYEPGDEFPVSSMGDRVVVVIANVVDEIAKLNQPSAGTPAEHADQPPPDPYVVVPCVNTKHRRVNDILIVDPNCATCLGLGLVRVLREHVPVVHRHGDEWVRGDDAVSRLADLGKAPP